MPNYSYENDFDVHENETACRTHFHVTCFALMKQRHKRTRKWPILEKLYGISYLFSGAFRLQGKDNSFSIFTLFFSFVNFSILLWEPQNLSSQFISHERRLRYVLSFII